METTMERHYRVMADSAEWYANNICRNGGREGFDKLAQEYRKKQAKETTKRLKQSVDRKS